MRIWALPNGLPPAHLVRAALRAAGLIDAYGSPVPAARSSYLLYPSDALYPPTDLRMGEQLLLDCGVLLEKDGYLYPSPQLAELLAVQEDEAISVLLRRAVLMAPTDIEEPSDSRSEGAVRDLIDELIPNPERREALLVSLGRKYDEEARAELGLRGEEFIVELARGELVALGRSDLAAHVTRLSAFSDDLGYDVVAPRIEGRRRLEVKTSRRATTDVFHFYISRQEMDWGLVDPDWALIACHVRDDDELELVGWCRAQTLEPYLPADGVGGNWVSAEVETATSVFEPGLPTVL